MYLHLTHRSVTSAKTFSNVFVKEGGGLVGESGGRGGGGSDREAVEAVTA